VDLAFALPQGGQARLRVYDVAGRLVRTLVDGPLAGGEDRRTWDGRDDSGRPLGGGLYFGRLESAHGVVTAKLTLVR
jgi:flagellar hook assembly protein FlgD